MSKGSYNYTLIIVTMLSDYLFTSLTMVIIYEYFTYELDVYCTHVIVLECFVLHNINLLHILRNIYI